MNITVIFALLAIGAFVGITCSMIRNEKHSEKLGVRIGRLEKKIEELESETESENVEVIEITDHRTEAPHDYFKPF